MQHDMERRLLKDNDLMRYQGDARKHRPVLAVSRVLVAEVLSLAYAMQYFLDTSSNFLAYNDTGCKVVRAVGTVSCSDIWDEYVSRIERTSNQNFARNVSFRDTV